MWRSPWTLSGKNLEARDNLLLGDLVQWLSECCPQAGPSTTMQHLHVLLALIKSDLVRPLATSPEDWHHLIYSREAPH